MTARWTVANLGDVASLERDMLQPGDIKVGTPYVGLEHVDGDGQLNGVTGVSAGELGSTKYAFGPEHVLYGKLRPYLRKTARPGFKGICSTEIVPIRPGPRIDRDYLFHFLRHPWVVDLAVARCAGANLPRISTREILSFEVPLPSMSEQRRIADILDKADAICRKRKEAIALTDELLRSAFLDIVGPGAAGYSTWPVRSIEKLAVDAPNAMRTGPFGSDLRHSEFVDDGIAVLGIDNAVQNRFAWGERRYITPEKYDGLRRYTVMPGDVIVTIMGTTGRSAVVPDEIPLAITTKHLATLTLDRTVAEPEFVSQAIHRHPAVLGQIAQANRGAIMAGLNLGLIRSLEVPLPPLEAQRAFTRATLQIRAMQTRLETARVGAEELFSSLVSRAFAGELGAPESGASAC